MAPGRATADCCDDMTLKRMLDVAVSATALVCLSPFLLPAALAVKLSSPGPIFFRQARVGRHGQTFRIIKLRTMRVSEGGRSITVGRDPRITRLGQILRQSKIDEIPQLINVLRGEMSLVGPRPEVPEYVARYPQEIREKILSVRPGITDRSSIKYRSEGEMLAQVSNPEEYYETVILPDKLAMAVSYAENASIREDIMILFATIRAIVHPRRATISRGDSGSCNVQAEPRH
jgi:lipopolysaccharide/colanic/teichoic acid biosynthesis glycosyltransferase